VFCSLLSIACVTQPEIYAPPAQRRPLDQEILVRTAPVLDMGDPNSERYFVSDIARGAQQASWRWTGPRPTVKLALRSVSNLRYFMEFTIPDVTFKDTGPVTITYYVNDHELDKGRYDSPGAKVFDKPIPPGFLKPMDVNTIAAEVDKPWLSKNDGQKLGFILSRIGLQQ
jgi:hypothetical protein